MSQTAEHRAIVTAYENEGMLPDEIASDRGLDPAAVKGCLMQYSTSYRKACGQEPENEDKLNFTNEELERVNEVLVGLALSAESEKVRLTAAMYIRDDKKGRKDVVKGVSAQQNNIFLINQQMAKVREITGRVKNAMTLPPSNSQLIESI